MRRFGLLLAFLGIGAAAFLGGWWLRGVGPTGGSAGVGERKVLYWVDPMNPALRSDKPGIAPCGMPLEPVYADAEPGERPAGLRPEAIRITPERQQTIGVRVASVDRKATRHSVRLLGRVTADETRVFRLVPVTEGWMHDLASVTTGSVVRRGQKLASYYSQEVLGPQQAYIYAIEALERFRASGQATPDQIALNMRNVETTRQTLRNLGVGEAQLDEIARERVVDRHVDLLAPSDGVILARNVTAGQWFDRYSDLFVIADLSRIWILADAYEGEAELFLPGTVATVTLPYRRKTLEARVTSVPPVFDAGTRTLKIRLEAANPGLDLRPDMFVDVTLTIERPPALVVPADAVLDVGLRKTVFVDGGDGFFEPRIVMTGWSAGGEIEVVSGLQPGERIVVSGNFLLDSESRMRSVPAGRDDARAKDPVCGMEVDEAEARRAGRVLDHGGLTWYFCAPGCRDAFERDPERFLRASTAGPAHD